MKGVGRSNAAITFVNALFRGVGSAAGIALPVVVRAEVREDEPPASPPIRLDPEADTPLVRRSVAAATESYGAGRAPVRRIALSSRVPPGKGLKSSSAVSAAVIQAVASAYRATPTFSEIAALSAEVSRAVGLSATGAFDDALAAIAGGVVVTQNEPPRVLRAGDSDIAGTVVLWIPEGRHAPSPSLRSAFERRAADAHAAIEAALAGRFIDALELNGRLVEEVMGYDYREIRAALHAQGALGAGVSGLGPTLASIVPKGQVPRILGVLKPLGGQVLRVGLQVARPLPTSGPG